MHICLPIFQVLQSFSLLRRLFGMINNGLKNERLKMQKRVETLWALPSRVSSKQVFTFLLFFPAPTPTLFPLPLLFPLFLLLSKISMAAQLLFHLLAGLFFHLLSA